MWWAARPVGQSSLMGSDPGLIVPCSGADWSSTAGSALTYRLQWHVPTCCSHMPREHHAVKHSLWHCDGVINMIRFRFKFDSLRTSIQKHVICFYNPFIFIWGFGTSFSAGEHYEMSAGSYFRFSFVIKRHHCKDDASWSPHSKNPPTYIHSTLCIK